MQQLVLDRLTLFGPVGELLPTIVPTGLVARKVGHHRTQCRRQRTHVSRNGTAAGRRGLAGRLVGKTRASHVHQLLLLVVGLHHVFNHLFFRIERTQIVQAHRLDGNLDDFLFVHAQRTLLLS